MTPLRPLRGRTIIVTRGLDKGDGLGELLEAVGATVVRVPLIATEPLVPAGALAAAVRRLREGGSAAWLVLTSETAARLLFDDIGDPAALGGVAVAVVGPATAAAVRSRGVQPALEAGGQVAESLALELRDRDVRGAGVLIVAAAGGRDVVAGVLRDAGAQVDLVEAYRSVPPEGSAGRLQAALAAGPPDAVTFTSGSTVRHFATATGGAPPPACPAVCIGPVTAAAARRAGWARVVTAADHTAAGVAAATVSALAAEPLP